jgi:hypothetical protein
VLFLIEENSYGEKGLKYVKKLDAKKYAKIKYRKKDVQYFVRFNYKENLTTDSVANKIISSGVLIK